MKPAKKIGRARTQLNRLMPFFGYLSMYLKPEEIDDDLKEELRQNNQEPTIGVAEDGTLVYDPDFIDQMEAEEVEGLLAHEVMHLAMEHFARTPGKAKTSRQMAQLWNVAQDIKVDSMLTKQFKNSETKLPKSDKHGFTLNLRHDKATVNIPGQGRFDVQNISDKPAEELFEIILDRLDIDEQQQQGNGKQQQSGQGNQQGQGGGGQGQSDDSDQNQNQQQGGSNDSEQDGQDSNDGQNPNQNQSEDDENDSDSQNGQGNQDDSEDEEQSDSDSRENDSNEQEEDSDQQDGQGQGSSGQQQKTQTQRFEIEPNDFGQDQHYRNKDFDHEDRQENRKDWANNTVKAAEQAKAKEAGDIPNGMERRLDELTSDEVIDWRTELQNYITNRIQTDYDWTRPSKKSKALGFYQPDIKRDSIEVVVGLDTSGSIGKEELQRYAGQMVAICQSFEQVELTVIKHTSEVYGVEEFTNPTQRDFEEMDIQSGGTDHRPVFQEIAENHRNAEILVNFTDAESRFPDRSEVPSQLNTIWMVDNDYRDYGEIQDMLPFGRGVKIEKE